MGTAGGVGAVLGAINLDKGVEVVKKLFEDKGWQKPTMLFVETETTIEIVINGSNISDTPLEQDFYSNYWWGKMRFSGHYGQVSDDTLNVVFQIYHHAGSHRPHDPDNLEGDPANPSVTINSGTAGKSQTSGTDFPARDSDTKWVKHPGTHSDQYVGVLNATCHAGKVWCDILNWGYRLEGKHIADQPISLKFATSPRTSGDVARLAIRLDGPVTGLSKLHFALNFDPELGVEASEVEIGDLFSSDELRLDLASAGRLGFQFRTNKAVKGPGTLATVRFHIPQRPLVPSYAVGCSQLEAQDLNGSPVVIGSASVSLNVLEFHDDRNLQDQSQVYCVWEDKKYSQGAVVKMGDGKCHTCGAGGEWGAGESCS